MESDLIRGEVYGGLWSYKKGGLSFGGHCSTYFNASDKRGILWWEVALLERLSLVWKCFFKRGNTV